MDQIRELWGMDMLKKRISGEDNLEGYPPAAPLHEEAVYQLLMRNGLEQSGGNSIFVMGMTVAVRRAANEVSNNVLAIDVNNDAIDLLGPAIDKKYNEKILAKNWFDLPDFLEDKADVIAGDGIFCTMGSTSDSIKLLGCLRSILAEHGAMVLRVMVVPENFTIEGMAFNDILADYRSGKLDAPEFGFAMRLWGFLDESYEKNSYMLDCGVAFSKCKKMVATGEMLQDELDVMNRTYYIGKNYVPPINVWEHMLEDAGFKFEKTTLEGKHWFQYFPLYYCRKE